MEADLLVLLLLLQTSPLGSWQSGDDEPIGVIDHLSKLVVVDRSVEVNCVPVALVLVVAGAYGCVSSSQVERQPRSSGDRSTDSSRLEFPLHKVDAC